MFIEIDGIKLTEDEFVAECFRDTEEMQIPYNEFQSIIQENRALKKQAKIDIENIETYYNTIVRLKAKIELINELAQMKLIRQDKTDKISKVRIGKYLDNQGDY